MNVASDLIHASRMILNLINHGVGCIIRRVQRRAKGLILYKSFLANMKLVAVSYQH